ncbi:MAG: hypothetical protein CMH84_12175 [Nocardioides sp.]|nr:hypothetical protein [Nocardioides sp.]
MVDDAATFPPGDAPLDAALTAYADRAGPAARLVRSLVVRDTDLPQVPSGTPVSVALTGGAGQVHGPAQLCQRRGLPVAGIEIALRDVDDPAGNARRVVAAVDAARGEGVLDEDTPVFVELPAVDPAYSWLAAADEVAAAELRLKLRTGGLDPDAFPTPERLAAWIDAALDRELPFKCTAGLHRALPHVDADGCGHHGFLTLLAATRVAFDGGSADDVVATLRRDDATDLLALDLAGARRWFPSFGSCSIDEPLADLRELVSL